MPENRSSTKARPPGRLWAFRALKFVVSMTALVVLVGLAWKAVLLLFGSLPDHDAVLGGLSAFVGTVFGVAISLIKKMSSTLGALSRWIAGDSWRGFLSDIGAFSVMLPLTLVSMVICVALGIDLFSDGPERTCDDRPVAPGDEIPLEQRIKTAMTEHGYTADRAKLIDNLAMLEAPRIEDHFRLLIPFERGQLRGSNEAAVPVPDDISDVRFSAGLGYARTRDRGLIMELVSALKPCAAAEGCRPVRLRVEGYASSEPFEHVDADASLRLNVHLANERRRVVESDLRAEIGRLGARIELMEVPDYTEMSEMELSRRFNDRPGDSPARGDYEQDFFTRAAYIRILDLAGCSYEGP